MKIFSIYESMQRSAKFCPKGENIKLVIRHSIRQEFKNEIEGYNSMLTREGVELARRFGKELETPIGTVSSSLSQRCVDTCRNILSENSSKAKIRKTSILQNVQNNDDLLAGETFLRHGIRYILDSLVKKEKLPGLNSLEFSVNEILDYIFKTGNKKNSIDIFCTHDFQIAMMLLFLQENDLKTCKKLFENWIYMLEVFFIYGSREKFTLIWRGEYL